MQKLLLFSLLLLCSLPCKPAIPDSVRQFTTSLSDSATIEHFLAAGIRQMYKNPDAAQELIQEAWTQADQFGDQLLLAKAYNHRGTIKWIASDYMAAIKDFETGLEIFGEEKDTLGMAKANSNIGMCWVGMSEYDLALKFYMEGLNFMKGRVAEATLATFYNNLGNVYQRNKDFQAAEKYYQLAIDGFTQANDTNALAFAYNNMGSIFIAQKKDDQAFKYLETGRKLSEFTHNDFASARIYSNLGSIYANRQQYQEAEKLYRKIEEINQKLENPIGIALGQLKLAELFVTTRDYKSAIRQSKKAQINLKNRSSLFHEKEVFQLLSKAYQGLQKYDSALFYHQDFKALNDSIFNQERSKSISELRIRFDSEIKDQQIATLDKENELNDFRQFALVTLLALLSLTAVIIFLYQRRLLKREKAIKKKVEEINQARQSIAQAEAKAAKAERKRLQEEVKYKSKEISNLAMNLVRRNEMMETLDRELKAVRKSGNNEKIKELSIMVGQNTLLEKERKEIQLFIQEAQQNFFLKLEQQFPKLTSKEKRLCAMIKMSFSSKEIAAVFQINTSSVEVSRYRLRKKMAMESNQNLKEFLDNL